MKRLIAILLATMFSVSLFGCSAENQEPPEFMNQDGIPLCEMTEQQAVDWMQEYVEWFKVGEEKISIEVKEFEDKAPLYYVKIGDNPTKTAMSISTSDDGKIENISVISTNVDLDGNAFIMGCAVAITLTDHYQEFDLASSVDYFGELIDAASYNGSADQTRGEIEYEVKFISELAELNISMNGQ